MEEDKGNSVIEDDLTLEYYGPSVRLGKMDSYEVASNIIAFSDFVGVLSKNAYGEKIEMKTEIRGFRGESFDIDFALTVGGFIANFFGTSSMSPKELVTLMKDAIAAWRHLMGQNPKEIKPSSEQHGLFDVINQEGQIIYASHSVVNVITSEKAGRAVEQFIRKPLESGVDELRIRSKTAENSEMIRSSDAGYFRPVNIERPLTSSEVRMGLIIESPTFKDGNKWKFFDGQNSFFADISDEDFLVRVDAGIERFGKGDSILAIVQFSQTSTIDSIKMERTILKVIEHKEAPEQKKLLS